MENLENDVKKPEILSDEQLKEVAGGKISGEPFINTVKSICVSKNFSREACMRDENCAWISNRCLPNPKRYDYDYKSEI